MMSSKAMVAMTLSMETSNRATVLPTATIRSAEAMEMTLSMGTTPIFPGTHRSAREAICSMAEMATTPCMALAGRISFSAETATIGLTTA